MPYLKPSYVDPEIGDRDLSYVWDDTRTGEDFQRDGDWLIERLHGVYLSARIALGIGIYEWISWRYQALSNDRESVQLAQAAWCATVHPAYMQSANFDRYKWMGPIRGPLWCAQTWLVPMARCDRNDEDECEDGVSFLYCLAMHVLPTTTAFEAWLDGCANRLIEFYTAPGEDPFADLFLEPAKERSPLIAPVLLDLTEPFDQSRARNEMSDFLKEAQRADNPFLLTAEGMQEAGFRGIPYEITP